MKCPQCGLNNLEHIEVCVKCGWLLVSGSLPEDFSPEAPRARRLNKIKRLYWKWRRSRRIILPENSFEPKIPFWKNPFKSFSYGEPVPGSLLAMVLSFLLPGLGQLLMGRRIRGVIFIIPSLLALLCFVLAMYNYSIDTLRVSMNVFLIFQCMSVFDAMPRIRAVHVRDWFVNIMLALAVWIGCFIAVNSSVVSATHYFWEGSELRNIFYHYPDTCLIQYDDTLLIQKKDSYARGNIVMYTCSVPYLYGNSTRWNTNYITLGKIIGIPGETVSVKNDIISVDSIELENQAELTLMPRKIPDMKWTLSTDEYFIITSTIQPRLLQHIHEQRKGAVQKIDNIVGHATHIVSPFARRKEI